MSDLSVPTLDRRSPRLSLSWFVDEIAKIDFRQIDVDIYDEDVLVETEFYDADPRGPIQVLIDAKRKLTAVRSALSRQTF